MRNRLFCVGCDADTKGTAADHRCCDRHGEKADAAPGGDAASGRPNGDGLVDRCRGALTAI